MKQPHKHAELIKAWADGAEIECRWSEYDEWNTVQQLTWYEDCLYRIKPKPKPDMITSVKVVGKGDGIFWSSERHTVIDANLKLTFDGETGNLKSAEVLK